MASKALRNHWKRPMAVLAGMELLVFATALCLISMLRFETDSPLADHDITEVLTQALLFAPVLSLSMAATGLYNERQSLTLGGLLTRILVSSLGGTLIIAMVSTLVPELAISREALIVGLILVMAGSAGCHFLIARLACEHRFKKRIVVFGAGRRAASLLQKQAEGDLGGFQTIGFIPTISDEPSAVSTERRIELRTCLLEHCQANDVAEIVVALDDPISADFPFKAFLECRLAGIEATDLAEFLERETGKVRIDLVPP